MAKILSVMGGLAANLAEQVSMSDWQKEHVSEMRNFVRNNAVELDKITVVPADPIQNPEVSLMNYARSDVSFFKEIVTMAIKAAKVLDDRTILKTLIASDPDVQSDAWLNPRKTASGIISSLNTTLSVNSNHIIHQMIRSSPDPEYLSHGM